ncbi:MAG TPA: hypothetical protein VFE05_09270 [Longimicrobiaceae bacterium]|jgi:hypothetical protein|nr:hypothetical protein [Longimicrobiaceae bacterium]
MGRHNREGRGEDQRGRTYTVAYPPDWLRQVKVTRGLGTGRQSTKTLLRNGDLPAQEPGPRVRTRVRSEELGIDFEVALEDVRGVVRRVIVETVVPAGADAGETIVFSICRTLDDAPADD